MESYVPQTTKAIAILEVQAVAAAIAGLDAMVKAAEVRLIHTEKRTLSAAEMFGNLPEYAFVNTKRAEGAPPAGETASAFLPYAGFAVMRSDWSADAAYLCFDVGPLGMGHMHQDKLNIILFKGDEELLYDDGGGQYEISPARKLATATSFAAFSTAGVAPPAKSERFASGKSGNAFSSGA